MTFLNISNILNIINILNILNILVTILNVLELWGRFGCVKACLAFKVFGFELGGYGSEFS